MHVCVKVFHLATFIPAMAERRNARGAAWPPLCVPCFNHSEMTRKLRAQRLLYFEMPNLKKSQVPERILSQSCRVVSYCAAVNQTSSRQALLLLSLTLMQYFHFGNHAVCYDLVAAM